ncbi:hypothetical protein JM946_01880 [Steroidobacter sp. S1-65]|uniref:Uncharacterized protein n=1 Tax=Steroidobacter gossypii TaxID=2805490 RepID=A0ABS1WR76_9GAMM|nr:hypothetical protein [Steroidobacter gossypii]MBM0103468.1 hypothetical protein [Steroidobacter gossypii]
MRSFLAKLLNADTRLSELESRILNCVKDQLGADLTALWRRQVEAINKVQRLPGGAEVNFYRMERGRPTFDESLAFLNKAEELLIAKVTVSATVKGVAATIKAQVWCVRGFIFSIEYGSDPAYFEEAMAMDPAPDVLIECELRNSLTA